MKKKLISLLTALSMTLMLFGTPNVAAEEAHIHKECVNADRCPDCESGSGHTDITWTEWTNTTSLPKTTGNYYLADDVSVNGQTTITGKSVDIRLCLNGHTITQTGSNRIFNIISEGSLTICDCSADQKGMLTGGNYTGSGGAVNVASAASFTLNSGSISGNTASSSGGGVYITNAAFKMNGGTISKNTANSGGGGVRIYIDGTFEMNGGAISGNTAYTSGGVELSSNAIFNMNGGTISNNTASHNAGGVYVVAQAKSFTINGKVDISNNTVNGAKENVYIGSEKPISIGENFDVNSTIGFGFAVTLISDCTDFKKVTEIMTSDISSCFIPDNDNQIIIYKDNMVQITGAHTAKETTAKDATCIKDGNKGYWYCSKCKKYFSDSKCAAEIALSDTVVKAKGHTEVTDSAVEATCTAAGKTEGKHCSVCDTVLTAQEEIPALGHIWDDGVVTTPPTEEAEGVRTYTCTVCSETKTESVDKLEHTHVWSNTYRYDDVQHWKYCTECDEADTKADHTWDGGTVTAQPTEENAGVMTYACSVCSAEKTEPINPIAHTHKFSDEWTSSDTHHWYAATCGHDVISEEAEHTEDNGTVTTLPTAEAEGVKTFVCSVCGRVMRTEPISKLEEEHTHSFGTDWKKDSASHWHECGCGEKTDISAHTENSGDITAEPTETSKGTMTYSCIFCGYVIRTAEIPALVPEHTHAFGGWKYDTVNHWRECECGEMSELSAHVPSDWMVKTPATIEQEGVQIKVCTVCGTELDRAAIDKFPVNSGSAAEDVKDTAGTNAELTQDNALIENVLTPDDIAEIENGSSFEVVLEVTDIRDSVSSADVTAVSSVLNSDEEIGIYVDLSLFKIKDGTERTPIHNPSGQIGITLTIPESIFANNRTYSIVRVHDGTAENLGGTYDKANRSLTFCTDKFSTYAIAYTASNGGTDKPTIPSRPSEPSAPTTGGTTPVSPSVPAVISAAAETAAKTDEEIIADELYIEDVSSAAEAYADEEVISEKRYEIIPIIGIAVLGIFVVLFKRRILKK